MVRTFNHYQQKGADGFRSDLERAVALQITGMGGSFEYEKTRMTFVHPQRKSHYTPDFRLPNGIFIETKGRFLTADRKKHLLIKDQYPHVDIRFVFSRSATTISKQSKTTYAKWCEDHGFQYADKVIPREWLLEKG